MTINATDSIGAPYRIIGNTRITFTGQGPAGACSTRAPIKASPEWVDGNTSFDYRRFSADYLRVIPFDQEDTANETACLAYTVTFEPIP